MRAWWLLVAGCGRIGFDPNALASDGSTPDTADASTAGIHCARWSDPQRVADLSSPQQDYNIALHPNMAFVLVSSNRPSGDVYRLYGSSSANTSWSPPSEIDIDASLTQSDLGAAWSDDGTLLYFASYRAGPARMFTSAYDGTSFAMPEQILEITENPIAMTVRFDGLEMYFTRDGIAQQRIIRAARATTSAPWVTDPTPVPAIAEVGEYQGWATLTSDGLEMYMEIGTLDDESIYRTTRATLTSPWTTPTRVEELHSARSDGDPELSRDGRTLMLSSERDTQNDPDIFVSTCTMPAP